MVDREAIKERKKAAKKAATEASREEIREAFKAEEGGKQGAKAKAAGKPKKTSLEELIQGKPILIEVATLQEVLVSISSNPGRQEEALRLAIERADENGIFSSMSDFCHVHCKHRLDHKKKGLPGACEVCPIAGMALNRDELETLGLVEPSDENSETRELSKRDRMRQQIRKAGAPEEAPARRIGRGEIRAV